MVDRDAGIEKLIEGGLEFKTAARAFDILRPMFEADQKGPSRTGVNQRYYETHAEELKARARTKREEKKKIKSLKNPVKTEIKTLRHLDAPGYLAKRGTPQHDAWDRYAHETTGKSLPSDKAGNWRVASAWPPGYEPSVDVRKEAREAAI